MTTTSSTECYKQIRDLILQAKLLPGEKIKGAYLKKTLNLSLSPIREALARLSATTLVEFKDNLGCSVRQLSATTVKDIFKTHAKLECLLLRESIEHNNDAWESQIMAALYLLAKVEIPGKKISYSKWAPYNEEFHNALISGCTLNGLKQTRDEWLELKNWCLTLAYKHAGHKTITVDHEQHKALAQTVLSKHTDTACNKLYEHLLLGLDSTINLLNNNGFLI